jgi:hypothetical protein
MAGNGNSQVQHAVQVREPEPMERSLTKNQEKFKKMQMWEFMTEARTSLRFLLAWLFNTAALILGRRGPD